MSALSTKPTKMPEKFPNSANVIFYNVLDLQYLIMIDDFQKHKSNKGKITFYFQHQLFIHESQ